MLRLLSRLSLPLLLLAACAMPPPPQAAHGSKAVTAAAVPLHQRRIRPEGAGAGRELLQRLVRRALVGAGVTVAADGDLVARATLAHDTQPLANGRYRQLGQLELIVADAEGVPQLARTWALQAEAENPGEALEALYVQAEERLQAEILAVLTGHQEAAQR